MKENKQARVRASIEQNRSQKKAANQAQARGLSRLADLATEKHDLVQTCYENRDAPLQVASESREDWRGSPRGGGDFSVSALQRCGSGSG